MQRCSSLGALFGLCAIALVGPGPCTGRRRIPRNLCQPIKDDRNGIVGVVSTGHVRAIDRRSRQREARRRLTLQLEEAAERAHWRLLRSVRGRGWRMADIETTVE